MVEKSFEEVILDKMKSPRQREQRKRRKTDWEARVITEPEYLEELDKLEEGKKNKAPCVAIKSRKRGNIKNKSTKRKKQREKDTSSSSSSEECETDLSDESSEKNTSGRKNLRSNEELDDEEMLKNFWEILSLPTCESDVLNKLFACVYKSQINHIFLLQN